MKETLTQYKTMFLISLNFCFGAIIFANIDFFQQLIGEGLYHKIIPLFGINIPVGIISGIIMTVITVIFALMVISVDVIAYKKGIDAIPMKQKEEKPNAI